MVMLICEIIRGQLFFKLFFAIFYYVYIEIGERVFIFKHLDLVLET